MADTYKTFLRRISLVHYLKSVSKALTIKELMQKLKRHGFTESQDTVERDLKLLNTDNSTNSLITYNKETGQGKEGRPATLWKFNHRSNESILFFGETIEVSKRVAEKQLAFELVSQFLGKFLPPHLQKQLQLFEGQEEHILHKDDKSKYRLLKNSIRIEARFIHKEPYTEREGQLIETILLAIKEQKPIEFHYISRSNPTSTKRVCQPLGILFRFPDIDLIAECSSKPYKAIAFNLQRVEDLKISNINMKKSNLSIDDYFSKAQDEVVVVGHRAEAMFSLKQKYCEQIGETKVLDSGDIQFTLKIDAHSPYTLLFFLEHIQSLTVIQPEKLRNKIKQKIQEALERYEEDKSRR